MGKLEKYSSYKNSVINPFIEFPNHWDIKRFKHLFSFGKGLNITKENLEETGVECVNYGEIHSKFGFKINPDIHKLKCVNESYLKNGSKSLLNIGDFVFADTSEDIEGSGNFTHLIGNRKIFAGYHTMICRPQKTLNSKFYAYLFDSKSFRSQLHEKVKGVKVYSITQNILKDTFIWIPEDSEQIKIASFLDEKTAQIDEVITQKEKLIELLKERKQIVINDAVTKGLDKNVEFVDSGVEWIGNIPKHWEIEKVKYIFKDSSIKNHGEEIPLAATQLYGVVPKDILDYRTVEANVSDLNTFKLVKENNFVISLRSFEGGIEYSAYKGIISPAYTVMEALQDIAFKYFKYLFKSNIFIQALNIYKTGIREGQNISFAKFKDDFLPLPPKNEQIQIAEYIENQTSKIDKAIELQQNYISKLKEYKASLIDSVVTGKVRVV